MNSNNVTPFQDGTLSIEQRLDWLLANLNIDEKLQCLSTHMPDLPRLGIKGVGLGSEAAHGVQARHDQAGENGTSIPTTSFPQPIGMSASWDTELMHKAGEVVGVEARVIAHRDASRGLSRWAPTIDLERDPRWGRTEEGYGEDPVLIGAMASAYIRGMQGNHPKFLQVASTLKHFYANNTEEGRCWKNASIDPRNKYELYLEPFRRAIEDGHAEGVMTSYNKICGIPGILNPDVNEILKKQYGVRHAVGDGGALSLVLARHQAFGLHAESLAAALKAGVDAFPDNPAIVLQAAKEAYESKLITEDEIDTALRNTFSTKLRLGVYDAVSENPYAQVSEQDLDSPSNRKVCRDLSNASVVLMKNDNRTLPLACEDADSYVLVGQCADSWYQDWYCGAPAHRSTLKQGIEAITGKEIAYVDGLDRVCFYCNGKGLMLDENQLLCLGDEPDVFIKEEWGENSYNFRSVRTGKYLNMRLGADGDSITGNEIAAEKTACFDWFGFTIFHMTQANGNQFVLTNAFDAPLVCTKDGQFASVRNGEPAVLTMEIVESGIEKAVRLATGKSKVILALGCHPMVNARELIDRHTIEAIPAQDALLQALYKVNPNIVLVFFTNYPYALRYAKEHVPAILMSSTGSQDMGYAMADSLFGLNCPAGKLSMTWYESDSQLPSIDDYDIIKGKRTYRYFDRPVLFPFGHGLSYSTFSYSEMRLSLFGDEDAEDRYLSVRTLITNTGDICSDEVVEVYGIAPHSRAVKPLKQLIGFTRCKQIAPGETRCTELHIPVRELRFYDVISKSLMVEEGTYQLFLGKDCNTPIISGEIFIPGRQPGFRDCKEKIAADHYDDYENAVLTAGRLSYSAVTADIPEQDTTLQFRDCKVTAEPKYMYLYLKSEKGVTIDVLFDGKAVGHFTGNTADYQPSPLVLGTDRDRMDDRKRREQLVPIYTEIKLPLTATGFENGQVFEIDLKLSGDFKMCYFRLAEE